MDRKRKINHRHVEMKKKWFLLLLTVRTSSFYYLAL